MSENNQEKMKSDYRKNVSLMGKKEFTLLKMQEYGFWPKNLPTPYQRQKSETPEQYAYRNELLQKYKDVVNEISKMYTEKDEINKKLLALRKDYDSTWDYDRIRLDISKKIMKESITRRAEKKRLKELAKEEKTKKWLKKKANKIVFVGKGYSGYLNDIKCDENNLIEMGYPVIKTDKELAEFLEIDYKLLRFLVYHRDVVTADHYTRYKVPKKKGGFRDIAAPKKVLKKVQRIILENILYKYKVKENAHGFIKGKSVITNAKAHVEKPELVINLDVKDFFPTIDFNRALRMFKRFGYSGYIATLLTMICTYCERTEIEVKDVKRYVATSKRVLPQGAPTSPMITNIICHKLDLRLEGLAKKYGYTYTRYADDISFSIAKEEKENNRRLLGLAAKILKNEGFFINGSKTRFLRRNNRQSITGVVINEESLGIPRKWIKNFRAAIHNAEKLKDSGGISVSKKQEILGMVQWAKSVNEQRYKNIIERALNLFVNL